MSFRRKLNCKNRKGCRERWCCRSAGTAGCDQRVGWGASDCVVGRSSVASSMRKSGLALATSCSRVAGAPMGSNEALRSTVASARPVPGEEAPETRDQSGPCTGCWPRPLQAFNGSLAAQTKFSLFLLFFLQVDYTPGSRKTGSASTGISVPDGRRVELKPGRRMVGVSFRGDASSRRF